MECYDDEACRCRVTLLFCFLFIIAILFVIVSLPGSANLLAMLLLIYLSYSRNISLAA